MDTKELQKILDDVEKKCTSETKIGQIVWRLESEPKEVKERDKKTHYL
jgi:hypothetical protein